MRWRQKLRHVVFGSDGGRGGRSDARSRSLFPDHRLFSERAAGARAERLFDGYLHRLGPRASRWWHCRSGDRANASGGLANPRCRGIMALDVPPRRSTRTHRGGVGRHRARADAAEHAPYRRWSHGKTDLQGRLSAGKNSLAVDHRDLPGNGLSIVLHVWLDGMDADVLATCAWMVARGSRANFGTLDCLLRLPRDVHGGRPDRPLA